MKKRIMSAFGCVMVVFGMMIAGSEGPWFPWLNLVGLLMVAVVAALVDRKPGKDSMIEIACTRGSKVGRS